MGRLIGYMANRADRLADAIFQERALAVATDSASLETPTGWGIGFYQGGEVLHKKRPRREKAEPDWDQITSSIRSDCVVLHVRQPTVGDFRAENTHPFRMRSWLFAHHGTIDRFATIRESLVQSLPDFLRRNIRGSTDSEVYFHVLLSFLHDTGQLDHPDLDERAGVGAVRSSVALIDRLVAEEGGETSSLNMVLTNGRRMFALRRGLPMAYVRREGIFEMRQGINPLPPEGPGSRLCYVMVRSNGVSTARDWHSMNDDEVLTIDRNLNATIHSD